MAEPFIGEIKLWAPNFAPLGWALCDGQLLSIAQNTALFSLLGTIYGGDGLVTFALPDLRGRIPIHAGQGPGLTRYMLGQKGGQERVTLATNNLPAHSHTNKMATAAEADSNDPTDRFLARTDARSYTNEGPAIASGGTTGETGAGQSVENIQPYLSLNYIIALQGIYPPRP